MIIAIGGKIKITDFNADPKLIKWLEDNYQIDNPEYIKRVQLNLWLGTTPKKLKLYTCYPDRLIYFPYGFMRELISFVRKNYPYDEVHYELDVNEDKTAKWGKTKLTLRDYQEEAVEHMLKQKFGILKAPCSSGKTIMGHELARRTGMKTLWLTHTRDLLNQSMQVGIQMVGEKNVGTITNGKVNIGKVITYATMQTMGKMSHKDFAREFNCVIVDECHRCNTTFTRKQMSYIVNTISAEYKYGLSATPETFDGLGRTILANLGPVEWTIEKEELIEQNRIMGVKIVPIHTGWVYPDESYLANGTVDFHEAVKCMSMDRDRNKLIVSLLKDKPTIILADKTNLLVGIMNELSEEQAKDACLISTRHDEDMLTGNGKLVARSHNYNKRLEYLTKMANGEYKYMFATYQLAKEGLNIPILEQAIFAFPAVNPNIITQSIGRVARTCEGKELAVVYDLVDKPKYFQKLYKQRLKLYEKENNKVIDLREWGL